MYAPAPAAEVRLESQVLPAIIAQTIDELSGKALSTHTVQATKPGTVGRRDAVKRYVQRYWPRTEEAAKVGRWYDTWVSNLRRETLGQQAVCTII
jgi:hypothetical protein